MAELSFWVPGIPQPQGSTRPFRGRGKAAGKIFTTSDNVNLQPWRNSVTWAAQLAMRKGPRLVVTGNHSPDPNPMTLFAEFYFPRPKFHFGKTGLLGSAPMKHCVKPDLSKLVRAVEDSLTDAGFWRDDNQVTTIAAAKHYADLRPPGVQITVTPMAQPAVTPGVAETNGDTAAPARSGLRRVVG